MRELRALDRDGERIRLIAITGYGQEGDRARTAEAGFDGHVVKPATFVTVMGMLAEPTS